MFAVRSTSAFPQASIHTAGIPLEGSVDNPGQQTALIYVGIILLLVLSLIGGLEVLIKALT